MTRLKIIILARHALVREGLRALLTEETDFQISTLAPTDEWLDDLFAAQADVLLLDVQVLEREGWRMLDELRRALPALTLIVVGDNANDRRVAHALTLGARGYVLREASGEELAHAIRAAHNGIVALHPQIAARLLTELRAAENFRNEEELNADDLIEPLSERELDVLRALTRGQANKQIAAELFITEHTVKFHIRSILGKLGAANRTEAVTLALQKGLVSL